MDVGLFQGPPTLFVVDDEVMSDDIAFLADRLDCRVTDVPVTKHTRRMHVSWVLKRFGYRQRDEQSRLDLEADAEHYDVRTSEFK